MTHDYHWTPASQRAFLEALAETGSVTLAAQEVGMTPRAAHGLRARGAGMAFRIGWAAALLHARMSVEAMLLDRVVTGEEVTTTRDPATGAVRRARDNNRLGLHLLTRLDKQCEIWLDEDRQSDAQIVYEDFDGFLDLLINTPTPAQIRAFIESRQAANQCELARDSAVFAAAQDSQEPQSADDYAAGLDVWWDEADECWYTNFPFEPGPQGKEDPVYEIPGEWEDPDYRRELTDAEVEIVEARRAQGRPERQAAAETARRAWFGLEAREPEGV